MTVSIEPVTSEVVLACPKKILGEKHMWALISRRRDWELMWRRAQVHVCRTVLYLVPHLTTYTTLSRKDIGVYWSQQGP